MNGVTMKSKVIWGVLASLAMLLSFIFCRYVFFDLHGMKQWPFYLFVFGLMITLIGAVFEARCVMLLTATGYIGGFALGILFGVDHADSGGGRSNNMWVIWTVSFLIIILVGIIWELLNKQMLKNRS